VLAVAGSGAGAGAARSPTVRFAFTGDLAMVAGPADSYFAAVRRSLSGDVVLGNLEGTLTDGASSKCGAASSDCFAFHAPPSYAPLLRRAGFTVMNLANNHALDYGESGQRDTVAAVRRAGLLTTGRPGEIAYAKVRGIRVAVLGFAPYPWAQSLLNLTAAAALVRKADQWADLVVVTMHAGAEGADQVHTPTGRESAFGEDRGNTRRFAHAVVDAGADLVVGSGPHVVRGVESYRGRLIAYSLGNFLGFNTFEVGGVLSLSGIVRVELDGTGALRDARWLSIRLTDAGTPEADPARESAALVSSIAREDFSDAGMRVVRDSRLVPAGDRAPG
jgi:poly-gamma-glutamate capsule biosynthesis protein CapA/YwtB (metallophosphatase superfamily)